MAETLGSLCDKLTIVKLKQYHTDNELRQKSLAAQEMELAAEIDEYLAAALNGMMPLHKLEFASNKVYKAEGNEVREISGNIGQVISELAKVNCELWHEQEKVYDFESILPAEKNSVVKKLAILNLERNKCMDQINLILKEKIKSASIVKSNKI